jgi:hypothetical protein
MAGDRLASEAAILQQAVVIRGAGKLNLLKDLTKRMSSLRLMHSDGVDNPATRFLRWWI